MYSGIVNGQSTTFGTSGLLYRSNKVMYDRATRSLWHQFTGEPIIGPLAYSGIKQPFFSAVVATWEEWLAEHPDTTVLANQTGVYQPEFYVPEDDPRAIYYDYFSTDEIRFPVWFRDPVIEPRKVVVGLAVGDGKKAYTVDDLRQARVVNDAVGGVDVVIAASGESRSARAYERQGETFSLEDGQDSEAAPRSLVDSAGARWQVTEEALVREDDPSMTLSRIPTQTSFWFGWYQYNPDTEIYQPDA